MTLQYTAVPYIALHPAVVYCAQSAVLICVNEGCGGDWVNFFGENERIVGGVSIMKKKLASLAAAMALTAVMGGTAMAAEGSLRCTKGSLEL